MGFIQKTQSEFDAIKANNQLITGEGYLIDLSILVIAISGNTFLTVGNISNVKTFFASQGQTIFTMPQHIPMQQHLCIINNVLQTDNTSLSGQNITTPPQDANSKVTIINLIP